MRAIAWKKAEDEKEEAREKGHAEGLAAGLAEGRSESLIEIAKNMINEKIPIEVISKCTSLPIEKIRKMIVLS